MQFIFLFIFAVASATSISTSISDDETIDFPLSFDALEESSSHDPAGFLTRCLHDVHILQFDLSKLTDTIKDSDSTADSIDNYIRRLLSQTSSELDRYERCLPFLVDKLSQSHKVAKMVRMKLVHYKTTWIFSIIVTMITSRYLEPQRPMMNITSYMLYERTLERVQNTLKDCP